jgi:CheY-like chemotaxis protein
LVVDDATSILKMISFILTNAGAKVTRAKNGLEAVEKTKRTTFDIVITDIQVLTGDAFYSVPSFCKFLPCAYHILIFFLLSSLSFSLSFFLHIFYLSLSLSLCFSHTLPFSVIQMPIMDGFEAARDMREYERLSGSRAKIIIGISAVFDGNRCDTALAAGDN